MLFQPLPLRPGQRFANDHRHLFVIAAFVFLAATKCAFALNLQVVAANGTIAPQPAGAPAVYKPIVGNPPQISLNAAAVEAHLNNGQNAVLRTSHAANGIIFIGAPIAKIAGGDAQLTLDSNFSSFLNQAITSTSKIRSRHFPRRP